MPEAKLRGEIYPPLTKREYEVLRTYVGLANYQEVADRLGISLNTVRDRMSRARRRYNAESTLQLLVMLDWIVVKPYAV